MKFYLLLFSLSLCFSPSFLFAKKPSERLSPANDPFSDELVLGKFKGKEIRMNEILNKQLSDLREQYFETLNSAYLNYVFQNYLKQNPELFKNQTQISDSDLKKFYDSSGLSSRGTFEQLKAQIKEYMENSQNNLEAQKVMDQTKEKGEWSFRFTPPKVLTQTIDIESAYLTGKTNSKVMLMEFVDYQCPYCKRVQPSLEKLRDIYGKKVAFAFRNYPLNFHTEADEASIAVECARDQGKFLPMHKKVFEADNNKFYPTVLKKLAKSVNGLDEKAFGKCLDEEKYRARVDRDLAVGRKLGINGTPSFLIGTFNPKTKKLTGELLSGALPYQTFQEKLEKYLAKTNS